VGRLDNIIARNRRPHGLRATWGFLWRGLFLLLILVLLIFTNWALSPDDGGDGDGRVTRPPPPGEHRLRGVPVLRPAPRPR
jgi:hypothetical protein